MGQTESPASAFQSAADAERKRSSQKKRYQNRIKNAKNRLIWWAGIMFTWFPVLVCLVLVWLLDGTQNDPQVLENYSNYILEFFTSGSFLWLSVTLLGTSLLQLLLFGFKKYFSPKQEYRYIRLVIISVIIGILATILYIVNIGSPFKVLIMIGFSIVSFLLFAMLSHIVSFRLVQEV